MRKDYVLTVRIEKNATDILNLPCVEGCVKDEDGRLVYDVNVENCQDSATGAREGDLLCQREDGRWILEKGGGL